MGVCAYSVETHGRNHLHKKAERIYLGEYRDIEVSRSLLAVDATAWYFSRSGISKTVLLSRRDRSNGLLSSSFW